MGSVVPGWVEGSRGWMRSLDFARDDGEERPHVILSGAHAAKPQPDVILSGGAEGPGAEGSPARERSLGLARDDEGDSARDDKEETASALGVILSGAFEERGVEGSPTRERSLDFARDDGEGFAPRDDVSSRSRPRICVSACLLGERCRWDGGSKEVAGLAETLAAAGCEAISVCPEVLGGLPTPREPAEIRGGRVVTRSGADVTAEFELGARRALERLDLGGAGITATLLQPRSPSCGVDQVYDGSFTGRLVPGDGIFTQLLRAAGVPCLDGTKVPRSFVPSDAGDGAFADSGEPLDLPDA